MLSRQAVHHGGHHQLITMHVHQAATTVIAGIAAMNQFVVHLGRQHQPTVATAAMNQLFIVAVNINQLLPLPP